MGARVLCILDIHRLKSKFKANLKVQLWSTSVVNRQTAMTVSLFCFVSVFFPNDYVH